MLLRSGAAHFEAQGLALSLAKSYNEKDRGPFPYEDCRWLKRQFDAEIELESLIPDLSMWFCDIAGIANHGKALLRWSEEQLSNWRGIVSLSFFEKQPEYAWLERHIGRENTPYLFEKLHLYEQMRADALALFDFMLSEKAEEANL